MGFFKRKDKVIDLGERYRRQQEKLKAQEGVKEETQETTPSPFAFFDSQPSTSSSSSDDEVIDLGASPTDKKRKLVKRILEMTSKMEDLSNQIYHMQQRIEVLEKKLDVNRHQ